MSFAAPLGLLALLAVPAVIALHLFRRRLPQVHVAGLFLWDPQRLAARAGRKRARLLQTASLWLEVLAAVLVALWLAGPRFGLADRVPHLVVVLDDSASMGAGRGETARDRAVAVVREQLDELSSDALVTVIASGPRPEVLLGPRALRAGAQGVLDAWQPRRTDHDLAPALDLAVELGSGQAEIWLVTDHRVADAPPEVHVVGVGRAAPNAGFLSVRRVDAGSGERILADVGGWGGGARTGSVVVAPLDPQAGAPVVAEVAIDDPSRPARLTLEVPRIAGPYHVELRFQNDGLALDDVAELLPEPTVPVALCIDGLADDAALRLELPRVAKALRGVVLVDDPAQANVRVVPAPVGIGPGRHEIVVAPVGDGTDPWIGPYLIERRHPLADGVTLDGVVWTSGRGPLPGFPILLAGQQVLLSEEAQRSAGGGGLRLHLNLDPLRTNLPSSPDWPILIDNLARRVRDRAPGPSRVNLQVGEFLEWRPRDAVAVGPALTLVDAEGREWPGRGRGTTTWEARQPGVHRLLGPGGEELQQYAVRFASPPESDLTGCETFVEEATALSDEDDDEARVEAGTVERRLLALLLVLLLAADWWVLREGGRP